MNIFDECGTRHRQNDVFLKKFLLLLAALEKSYVNLIIKALRDKLPPLRILGNIPKRNR